MKRQSTHRRAGIVRTSHSNCEQCDVKFTLFFTREHHCKRCARSICADCAIQQDKVVLSLSKSPSQQKVCATCKAEMEYQKQTSHWMQAQWNKTSGISKNWAQHLNLVSDQKLEYQFKYDRQLFRKAYKEQSDKTLELLDQLEQSLVSCFFDDAFFNFSFVEWIYNSQKFIKREVIFDTIKQLVGTFYTINNKLPYNKNLFLTTVFLLTMCREHTAYAILGKLYLEFMPNIEEQNELQKLTMESENLLEFNQQFNVQPNDLKAVENFIRFYMVDYLTCFFINCVSFQTCYNIFNEFIETQNKQILSLYFYRLTQFNIKSIRSIGISQEQLSYEIIKNTSFKSLIMLKALNDVDFKPSSEREIFTPSPSRLSTLVDYDVEDEQDQINVRSTYHFKNGNVIQQNDEIRPRHRHNQTLVNLSSSQQNIVLEVKRNKFDSPSNSSVFNSHDDQESFIDGLISEQKKQIELLSQRLRKKDETLKQLRNEQDNLISKLKLFEQNQLATQAMWITSYQDVQAKQDSLVDNIMISIDHYMQNILIN